MLTEKGKTLIGIVLKIVISVLTAVVVTLKIHGVITWSWWWIASPVWIPIGILTVLTVIFFGGNAIFNRP